MNTTDIKALPPAAAQRIRQLEASVSELRELVLQLRSELQAQSLSASVLRVAKPQPAFVTRPAQHAGVAATHRRDRAAHAAGLAATHERGEAAWLAWVSTGKVVPARALAQRWGLTPRALGPAAQRGEVFAVVVKRQRCYPREFLELEREAVATLCRALAGLSSEEQRVFWKRPHGALGGATLAQFLGQDTGRKALARAVALAQAWVAEAGVVADRAAAA